LYYCQRGITKKFSDLATSSTWLDCVRISRLKFEKYFLHKALRLLHHFPPETETNAGKFWAHPKKIPNAGVVFSATDELHLSFVRTMAQCLAFLWGIQVPMLENNTAVNYHGNFNPANSRVKNRVFSRENTDVRWVGFHPLFF
jgi:hypothetical protein